MGGGKYNEPRQRASSIRSIRSSTRFDAGVCGWLAGHVIRIRMTFTWPKTLLSQEPPKYRFRESRS